MARQQNLTIKQQRAKTLRLALMPFEGSGATADQLQAVIIASMYAFRPGDYCLSFAEIEEILNEAFPDAPLRRKCEKNDIEITYTRDDNGLHLGCSNCYADVALGTFALSLAEFRKAVEDHLLPGKELQP